MTAPHFHTTDEAKGGIRDIEHNSAGAGPGPSGKMAGPPTEIGGGSAKNITTPTPGVTSSEKGADWISSRRD